MLTRRDYVIAGETNTYNYQTILKAVDLINKGARLIATNSGPDRPVRAGHHSGVPRTGFSD